MYIITNEVFLLNDFLNVPQLVAALFPGKAAVAVHVMLVSVLVNHEHPLLTKRVMALE